MSQNVAIYIHNNTISP